MSPAISRGRNSEYHRLIAAIEADPRISVHNWDKFACGGCGSAFGYSEYWNAFANTDGHASQCHGCQKTEARHIAAAPFSGAPRTMPTRTMLEQDICVVAFDHHKFVCAGCGRMFDHCEYADYFRGAGGHQSHCAGCKRIVKRGDYPLPCDRRPTKFTADRLREYGNAIRRANGDRERRKKMEDCPAVESCGPDHFICAGCKGRFSTGATPYNLALVRRHGQYCRRLVA